MKSVQKFVSFGRKMEGGRKLLKSLLFGYLTIQNDVPS